MSSLPLNRPAPRANPLRGAARHLAYLSLAVLLVLPTVGIAEGSTPFAAPAAVAPFAAPNEGMPLFRVFLALALVMGAVFAAAKLSRRMGVAGGAPTARLEILAQTALGPRERAILLRVAGRDVLVGVATGNVRLLVDLGGATPPEGDMPADAVAAPAMPARPNFRDLLMRSLGR